MKKSKILLAVFMGLVALAFVSSCNKDEGKTSQIKDQKLELRSGPGDWCDGGATYIGAVQSAYIDPSTGYCCVTIRTVANASVSIFTSNFDFTTGSGSQTGGGPYTGTSNSNGLVTICFPQIGTHFQVVVQNATFYGCDVFVNACH
jgi:hypothetical protein